MLTVRGFWFLVVAVLTLVVGLVSGRAVLGLLGLTLLLYLAGEALARGREVPQTAGSKAKAIIVWTEPPPAQAGR